MATVMKASEFVKKLKDVAQNYKTLYVRGCFGAPMNGANKKRYSTNNSFNRQPKRQHLIAAASDDTFGFDCSGLVKGVMWDWRGDSLKRYGGASYASNGVPDLSADQMIAKCSNISTDFSKIEDGEAVWCSGHIGVYIGDGLAVECTPRWANKVQITACNCSKSGYKRRNWTKHGKLPYIEYDVAITSENTNKTAVSGTASTGSATDEKTIWDYLMGKIGNAYGVAGLMGNLYAESALKSNNLQNAYESKLGYTDASYTQMVDNGSYGNFVKDSAGYGLAQWTYWSRKENLLNYAKSVGKSVGDLNTQLAFLYKELSESYSGVLNTLKSAKTVRAASDAVLTKFECPANKSESVQKKRAEYGQKYYDKYAVKTSTTTNAASTATKVDYAQKFDTKFNHRYKVTASVGLHIRTGAGTSKKSLKVLGNGTTVRCYGYYSVAADGTNWLYVQLSDKTVGFCSSKYLKQC